MRKKRVHRKHYSVVFIISQSDLYHNVGTLGPVVPIAQFEDSMTRQLHLGPKASQASVAGDSYG